MEKSIHMSRSGLYKTQVPHMMIKQNSKVAKVHLFVLEK